jgi:flagellar biosynthesis/type III secretory pathway protein FliH
MTALERWAYFFAYYTDPSKENVLRQITEHEEEINMAQKMLYRITPAEEQALYQMSVDKAIMDRASREDDFREKLKRSRVRARREGRAEGRQEGRAEGRQEGRAEGRQEGRAEGRQEGRAELASAIVDILRKGMTLEQVESYLRENGLQS